MCREWPVNRTMPPEAIERVAEGADIGDRIQFAPGRYRLSRGLRVPTGRIYAAAPGYRTILEFPQEWQGVWFGAYGPMDDAHTTLISGFVMRPHTTWIERFVAVLRFLVSPRRWRQWWAIRRWEARQRLMEVGLGDDGGATGAEAEAEAEAESETSEG